MPVLGDENLRKMYKYIYGVAPRSADAIRRFMVEASHFMTRCGVSIQQKIPWLAAPVLFRREPLLLIDTTRITKVDPGTGIQRVVHRVFSSLCAQAGEILAVRNEGALLRTSYRYMYRMGFMNEEKHEEIVPFVAGDRLLLLDSSWAYYDDFAKILCQAKVSGVKSYAVVYDLIPLRYPTYAGSEAFVRMFQLWHDVVLCEADGIICISRTVAGMLKDYYSALPIKRERALEIYSVHMGADITTGPSWARDDIRQFMSDGTTFLMVGTIEPRKGHMTAIRAIQEIAADTDGRLLILGHRGWKNEDVLAALELSEVRKRVLWIEDATDEELRWAYQHCAALLAASQDEGFGLPLIEAAYYGLPILCSDIPIFREVTQGHADYFKAMDVAELALALRNWIAANRHPDSRQIRLHTWDEAAREILEIMAGQGEKYRVFPVR